MHDSLLRISLFHCLVASSIACQACSHSLRLKLLESCKGVAWFLWGARNPLSKESPMQKKLFNHNFFLSPTSFIITISKPNFKCFNHVFVFASALWWIGRRRNNRIFYEQKWDIWYVLWNMYPFYDILLC